MKILVSYLRIRDHGSFCASFGFVTQSLGPSIWILVTRSIKWRFTSFADFLCLLLRRKTSDVSFSRKKIYITHHKTTNKDVPKLAKPRVHDGPLCLTSLSDFFVLLVKRICMHLGKISEILPKYLLYW
jgi:hypothetical protein